MSESIAIIGGSGFIGSNLANYLKKSGNEVLVIGRSFDPKKFNHSEIIRKELDVNFTTELIQVLQGVESIVWLVNNLVPGTKMDSLCDDFTFNISPLVKLIESVNQIKSLKRFVFLSSGGTIYGDSYEKNPIIEGFEKRPISSYGLSKIISENYLSFLTQQTKIHCFILRPSNVYGKHQNLRKPQGIIGYAFNSILNDKFIDLYGDGIVTRDFLYVDDLSEAIESCIKCPLREGEVSIYNVGSQTGYTIKEVLSMISSITKIKINTIPKPSRPFDCSYNVLSSEKIMKELKWEPKVNLKDGLALVWTWLTETHSN